MEEYVDISGYDADIALMQREFTAVLKDTPELYYVSTKFAYEAVDGKIIKIYPSYVMDRERRELADKMCRNEISRALLLVGENASDVEKLVLLHDYLCLNFSYDESLSSSNMYSFFESRRGTCQSYTYTYMALLRAAGITCTFAASDSMVHIWNLVFLDGDWYHVDVTWDDYPEKLGSLEYDSFLKSDVAIKKTAHRDWYSKNDILCVSEKYDSAEFTSELSRFTGTGDVNCDGELDVLDIVLCELENQEYPDNHVFLASAADMDRDGKLTDADLSLMRQSILA